MNSTTETLNNLFPLPTAPPSQLCPQRFPGISPESGAALVKVLKDNHQKWHAFFNDRGFHNHASHHMVAIYAMGAGGPLIEAAYQTHVSYMRPAFKSPEPIHESNFYAHLGERDFYTSYLEFFTAVLQEKGVTETLEEYVFSRKANVTTLGPDQQPARMLNRFLASILHPMIHTGCGLEFGFLGLVAEGLAQAACHSAQAVTMIPPTLFKSVSHPESGHAIVSRLTALLPSLSLGKSSAQHTHSPTQTKSGVHALTIISRILNDPAFAPSAIGLPLKVESDLSVLDVVQQAVGEALMRYVDEWTVDGANAHAVAEKIEELAWMNVLFYGVGGWGARKASNTGKFNADFFLMHLVTSSLFLPSVVAYLSPSSTTTLLRTFFNVSVVWWIARGRPALSIREFYAGTTPKPAEPGAPHGTPAEKTLTPADASPNPWLPILQTTLVHPAEHLCKVQRALAHYAAHYGTTPAGHFAELAQQSHGLEGAEVLDGTVFVRVAGLTADRMGWMREGQEEMNWDRAGFF